MSVDLRPLRYFVAVAEELHFGRAAQRLHMAQPPLSQAIGTLEQRVGARLLDRTTRRVRLTPAGEVYLRHARDVLARLERAESEARRIADGLEGRLVIGCVGSASYSLLPRVARALRADRPGLDLAVRGEMLTPQLVRAVHQGEVDLALTRRPDDDAGLQLTQLRVDPLMLAVPDGHALAGRKRVAARDLAGQVLVVHPGGRSHMHGLVTAAVAAAGVTLRGVQEVAETSTTVTFVAAGLGVAVLPEPARALGIGGVTWLPMRGLPPLPLLAAHRPGADAAAAALPVLRDVL